MKLTNHNLSPGTPLGPSLARSQAHHQCDQVEELLQEQRVAKVASPSSRPEIRWESPTMEVAHGKQPSK